MGDVRGYKRTVTNPKTGETKTVEIDSYTRKGNSRAGIPPTVPPNPPHSARAATFRKPGAPPEKHLTDAYEVFTVQRSAATAAQTQTVIVVDEKPDMGKLNRVCRRCGEPYEGWNFVVCPSCEQAGGYTVDETWRN